MYDLIIIGAGPAGLTAAIFAGRSRLNTLLIEKMAVGGRILMSESIENYPNDCVKCGGKGIAKPIMSCCMCKGKKKQEYEESYEETCPTCKGSGFVNNW